MRTTYERDAAKNHDANADSAWTTGWWGGKPNDDAYQETIRMAANRAARNGYAYPGDAFFTVRMATTRKGQGLAFRWAQRLGTRTRATATATRTRGTAT